jgi:hypothetical protein
VLLLLLRGGGRMFVHTISNLHLRARVAFHLQPSVSAPELLI